MDAQTIINRLLDTVHNNLQQTRNILIILAVLDVPEYRKIYDDVIDSLITDTGTVFELQEKHALAAYKREQEMKEYQEAH